MKLESAFPNASAIDAPQQGMSKRFYAACAAMQGIIASNNKEYLVNGINEGWHEPIGICHAAYQFADELLKHDIPDDNTNLHLADMKAALIAYVSKSINDSTDVEIDNIYKQLDKLFKIK